MQLILLPSAVSTRYPGSIRAYPGKATFASSVMAMLYAPYPGVSTPLESYAGAQAQGEMVMCAGDTGRMYMLCGEEWAFARIRPDTKLNPLYSNILQITDCPDTARIRGGYRPDTARTLATKRPASAHEAFLMPGWPDGPIGPTGAPRFNWRAVPECPSGRGDGPPFHGSSLQFIRRRRQWEQRPNPSDFQC